jgi:TctA family transporter
MYDALLLALAEIGSPERLVFLAAGTLAGLILGIIPGLGGAVGLAILLPFTFHLDSYQAMAMLIGMLAVTSTSDTIPAVLFGIPGTVASQATILDGHEMAKRGQAANALGAAFMASLMGGLFGAFVLASSIPLLQILVLKLGSPEVFMLGVLGLSLVAVLSGRQPLRGVVAAGTGLSLGMVGLDPQDGFERLTFGKLYLWDGLPIVTAALGLFAVPEVLDLARRRGLRSIVIKENNNTLSGIKEAIRHWRLVLRCSGLGVLIGAIPGLGSSVVDWFAYGHAMQSERDADKTFGKGDVRGVLAPESANNAKEGGALIPTIAFGIPGSVSMTLLLGAMLIHGLTPGPEMLGSRLDITYTIIFSLVVANIFATVLCLFFASSIARVASLDADYIVPFIITVVLLAGFQATNDMGDLWALVFFAVLGCSMKYLDWPRAPLILGLVLSGILENNLLIAVNRYGMSWIFRPAVLVILLVVFLSIFYGYKLSRAAEESTSRGRG